MRGVDILEKLRLTKILIEGNPNLLAQLADEIEKSYDITIDSGPEKSLVMMKSQNSVTKQPFYSGEVLVTECKVSINSYYGLGVIMGERPDNAYQLAIVDAAFNAELPETAGWVSILEEEEQRIRLSHQKESGLVAQSKVSFDTMEDFHAKS